MTLAKYQEEYNAALTTLAYKCKDMAAASITTRNIALKADSDITAINFNATQVAGTLKSIQEYLKCPKNGLDTKLAAFE
jgi:hypothetical protein